MTKVADPYYIWVIFVSGGDVDNKVELLITEPTTVSTLKKRAIKAGLVSVSSSQTQMTLGTHQGISTSCRLKEEDMVIRGATYVLQLLDGIWHSFM